MACDLVIFVEDTAVADFVADLPARLTRAGRTVAVFAAGTAREALRRRGTAFQELTAPIAADEWLARRAPRAILVGTAEDPRTPGLALIDAARRAGVPSVAVVDARCNAAHRFRGQGDDAIAHAPDLVLVPDATTRDSFVDLGLAAARVRVIGHPQHDHVRAVAARLEAEGRGAVRRRVFPAAGVRPILLFAAEPSGGADPEQFVRSAEYTLRGRGRSTGRTEIVLEELLDAVAHLEARPYLVLRLHPKCDSEQFRPYLTDFDQVSSGGGGGGGGGALEPAWSADLVAGMTSMLLMEAAIMGRPVLSILPRAAERSWLPAIELGLARCAATRRELRSLLPRMLASSSEAAPPVVPILPEGALDRMSAAVNELLESGLERANQPGGATVPAARLL